MAGGRVIARGRAPASSATMTRSRILVPLTDSSRGRETSLALRLASSYEAALSVVRPVVVPNPTPLELPRSRIESEREVATEALSRVPADRFDVPISATVRVGRKVDAVVANAAAEQRADLVVLDATVDWDGSTLRRSVVKRIAARADCDVVAVYGPGSIEGLASILVPVAGGPHSELAVEVAGALAAAEGAWVDVLHVIPPDASDREREEGEEYLDRALSSLDGDRADRWLLEAEEPAEAIVEQTGRYSATVMGTPQRSRLRRFVFGSTTDAVTTEATSPVVVAWHDE